MSKSRLGHLAHDDRGGNAMAAAVFRYAVWNARPWLRWKIDDREAAAWLQRSQQAGANVSRLCQMVVHVSQEDRVTALARQVRRTCGALQYHNVSQAFPRDRLPDFGKLLRPNVSGIHTPRRAQPIRDHHGH